MPSQKYPSITLLVVTFLAIFTGLAYGPLRQKALVLGFLKRDDVSNLHGERIVQIPNTLHCEDLHHHVASNLLFTACEDSNAPDNRRHWFPPLAHFNQTYATGQGSIVVIDPKTLKSIALTLENFSGPFITHGIDVLTSPTSPSTIYIFAVNHLAHYLAILPWQKEKAVSQIEIFHHTLGTASATHIRSVAHPAIRTPNDIYATSPTSFYVTNDHYHRGGAKRMVELLGWRGITGWSDTQYVTFDGSTGNASLGVTAATALTGLHNNNGIGHTEMKDVMLIGSAESGELTFVRRGQDDMLSVLEHVQFDMTVDNPSYYRDPWATPGDDKSGYVVAGLTNAKGLAQDVANPSRNSPVAVGFLKQKSGQLGDIVASDFGGGVMGWRPGPKPDDERWEKKTIFRDDGKVASAAATAVLVGLNPKENGGVKKGWLFVTGFLSRSVTAVLVDL